MKEMILEGIKQLTIKELEEVLPVVKKEYESRAYAYVCSNCGKEYKKINISKNGDIYDLIPDCDCNCDGKVIEKRI